METIIMYQIPRSIIHDPLPYHIAHHFVTFSLDHFVTFSLDRLLLPIDMTTSTIEAEYVATSDAAKEALWLGRLAHTFRQVHVDSVPVVYSDS